MIQHSHWSSLIAALGLIAGLSACGTDDDNDGGGSAPPQQPGAPGTTSEPATAKDPLVILTERLSVEGKGVHYIHVIPDWPASGELDYRTAIDMSDQGLARAVGDGIYFYHLEAGRFEKITVNEKLDPTRGGEILFTGKGISEFDGEIAYASAERAYLIDDSSGQIAKFNPRGLAIEEVYPISPAVLERNGLEAQFQHGLVTAGRVFITTSWRDWDTHTTLPVAAFSILDDNAPAAGVTVVEDPRCTPSVSVGAFEDDQYVYAVGDGANAFDVLASRKKTTLPQCVVRMRKNGTAFEPDFFVDLQQVTKSPAIRMVWPMEQGKILVNLWAPEIDPATVIKPGLDESFWKSKAWAYAVVDLNTKTSVRVAELPPGPMESVKELRVDGQNFLQVFREDRSSVLYRINSDATVVKVLEQPQGSNIQYLGRVKVTR